MFKAHRATGSTTPVRTARPPQERRQPSAPAWSLSIEGILEEHGLRLDAAHFDPEVTAIVSRLKESGLDLARLGDLADLDLPGQFSRIWTQVPEHGVPYLNASDLLNLFALGRPHAQRFLSHETNTDLSALIIREGWLLMTCSGTIGRVFRVPKRLDGWAATHDLIRIKPRKGMAGYLLAWCFTGAAQALILKDTHGGQIDHVTDKQVAELFVPILPESQIRAIDREVLRALATRERALKALACAWPMALAG